MTEIDPDRTHVVCIGIERYDEAMFADLIGVANAASRFAAWAIGAPSSERLEAFAKSVAG